MKRRFTFWALLLWVAAVVVSVAPAQAQQDIYSPVILGIQSYSPNLSVQIRPDGTGLATIPISGDLTHNGVKGRRYFLTPFNTGKLFPYPPPQPGGIAYFDFVAYDEQGLLGLVITSDRTISRASVPRWSIDGKQVAYMGQRWNVPVDSADGTNNFVVEEGLFVGTVLFDGSGRPSGLNERLLVPRSNQDEIAYPFVSWSWDSSRVAYSVTQCVRDKDNNQVCSATCVPDATGNLVCAEGRIFVAPVPPSGGSSACRVWIANSGRQIGTSQFSPVNTPSNPDNRLAFGRTTSINGGYRNDIWFVSVAPGYNCSDSLSATQVTNTSNANVIQLTHPEWSPDGAWLAFDAYNLGGAKNIYKIKANGSAKAINLTNANSKKMGYTLGGWRP